MPTYKQVRNKHLKLKNSIIASKFAERYDPNRETVIMLPGGLGSQLRRSNGKYVENKELGFEYDNVVWIDLGIIFSKDAKKIRIQKNERDKDNYIVLADGPLRFFAENPYDETKEYFNKQRFNYLSYGFDWRRSIIESASLLKDLLTKIKAEVIKKFGTGRDPLPNTTLLCHSMGGLVAKLFLSNVFGAGTTSSDVKSWMNKLITVATPFYGTSNHIFRYYKGQKPLNTILDTKTVCRIAGTMPGPYILMFLNIESYSKYLQDITTPELTRYPFRDSKDATIEVDPYAESTFSRYPQWMRRDFFARSRQERRLIVKELPGAVVDNIFHIRAVNKRTATELRWDNIKGNLYDPFIHKLPFKRKYELDNGRGDGTVPRWSARLAQVPNSQIYDLKRAQDHSSLLEHIETLKAVKYIIDNHKVPKFIKIKSSEIKKSQMATKKAVETYLNGVKSNQFDINSEESVDPKLLRRIMEDIVLT